jgi:hypothetical protein
MPEVQEAVEEILSSRERQSPAVFAAFGWWFIRLFLIDKAWTQTNIARMFDLNPSAANPLLGWAAWNTYLLTQSVYDETFELLRSQYQATVLALPELVDDQDLQNRPLGSLAVHLMIQYARGVLPLDEPNGMVQQFFQNSTAKMRSLAIMFIGQSIQNNDDLDAAIRNRLMKLWEWYWVNWGSTSDVFALAGYEFGTWFVTGAFDDAWCLQWLRKYSEVKPQVEPDT